MSTTSTMIDSTVPTKYWHRLDDGRVQCDLCPRFCKLHEGQRGFCFVRAREGGEIVLTTYGRSSGFCVDPIEKKPLYHFLPGTPVLSFGTAGCNLGCKFCQNWDISKSREIDTLADAATPETIARAALARLPKRRLHVQRSGHLPRVRDRRCPGVPRARAQDRRRDCRRDLPRAPHRVFPPHGRRQRRSESVHRAVLSRHLRGSLQPVLETLQYLKHETSVWFELTTLLIPGENDSGAELNELSQWVVEKLGPDVPLHFSAFHPDFRMMDRPRTPPETLRKARDIAIKNGVRYAYVGNVHDAEADSTHCHRCGHLLIGRDWYELHDWNLTPEGTCPECQAPCAGVFEPIPGSWGRRRQPVRLGEFSASARL